MNGLPLVNQQTQFQVAPKKNVLYIKEIPAGGYINVTNVDVIVLITSTTGSINGFTGGIPGQVIRLIISTGVGTTVTLVRSLTTDGLENVGSTNLTVAASSYLTKTYVYPSTAGIDYWWDSQFGATGIGSGDVIGPAGATDNAIARYDGATGKIIQNSTVIVSDAGAITGATLDSYLNDVGADHIHFKIKAMEPLVPGNIVRATGWNAGQNAAEVYKVTSPSTQVALGICHDTLATGDFGLAVHDGFFEGLDTSTFAFGDILYPNSSGGLTNVKPSGTYQAVAYVLRVQLNNGAVLCDFGEPVTPLTWTNQLTQIVWGTPSAEVSNAIEVSASSIDIDGTTLLTDEIGVMVVVSDGAADTEPSATATISAATSPVGTLLAGGGTATAVFKTNSSGNFRIRVTETATASRYIWVRAGGHFQRYVKARDGVLQLTFA